MNDVPGRVEEAPSGGRPRAARRRIATWLLVALFILSFWCPPVFLGGVVLGPSWVTLTLGVAVLVALFVPRATPGVLVVDSGCLVTGALVAAIVILALGRLVIGADDHHVVVESEGPDGCRVVVQERLFITSGAGRAAAVRGRAGVVVWASDWRDEDLMLNYPRKAYRVLWKGEAASVFVRDPGEPSREEFVAYVSCPR